MKAAEYMLSVKNAELMLIRRGSWLITEQGRWQMHSVQGPLETGWSPDRQYFRVETSSNELLLVSRPMGERGMRELRLESVIPVAQIA